MGSEATVEHTDPSPNPGDDLRELQDRRRWAERSRTGRHLGPGFRDPLFVTHLEARFGPRVSEFSEELFQLLYLLWWDGRRVGAGLVCSHCGTAEDVEMVGSMTAYAANEQDPDPNYPRPYCPECRQEYTEHWQEMWDEYYAGRL